MLCTRLRHADRLLHAGIGFDPQNSRPARGAHHDVCRELVRRQREGHATEVPVRGVGSSSRTVARAVEPRLPARAPPWRRTEGHRDRATPGVEVGVDGGVGRRPRRRRRSGRRVPDEVPGPSMRSTLEPFAATGRVLPGDRVRRGHRVAAQRHRSHGRRGGTRGSLPGPTGRHRAEGTRRAGPRRRGRAPSPGWRSRSPGRTGSAWATDPVAMTTAVATTTRTLGSRLRGVTSSTLRRSSAQFPLGGENLLHRDAFLQERLVQLDGEHRALRRGHGCDARAGARRRSPRGSARRHAPRHGVRRRPGAARRTAIASPARRSGPCSGRCPRRRPRRTPGSRRYDRSAAGGRRSCSGRRRASGSGRARRSPSAGGPSAARAPGTAAPTGCARARRSRRGRRG